MIILILHTSGEQLMNRYERVRQTRKGNFKRRWNCFVNEDIVVLVFEVMFTRKKNIMPRSQESCFIVRCCGLFVTIRFWIK